jgi:hypothetical protein
VNHSYSRDIFKHSIHYQESQQIDEMGSGFLKIYQFIENLDLHFFIA